MPRELQLPNFLLSYRSTPHATTNCSPSSCSYSESYAPDLNCYDLLALITSLKGKCNSLSTMTLMPELVSSRMVKRSGPGTSDMDRSGRPE